MKIMAAHRLGAFRDPGAEFLDKNHDKILNAIEALKKWYRDNADRGLETYIKILLTAFDYDEFKKPVYRAFPMPEDMTAQAEEGKTYTLETGLKSLQSWSASPKAAEDFINKQDYKTAHYSIFRLVGKGEQVCNYKWIRQVMEALVNTTKGVDDLYEINMDARNMLKELDVFEHEQEIILKLPVKSKVKLIKKLS